MRRNSTGSWVVAIKTLTDKERKRGVQQKVSRITKFQLNLDYDMISKEWTL